MPNGSLNNKKELVKMGHSYCSSDWHGASWAWELVKKCHLYAPRWKDHLHVSYWFR